MASTCYLAQTRLCFLLYRDTQSDTPNYTFHIYHYWLEQTPPEDDSYFTKISYNIFKSVVVYPDGGFSVIHMLANK